MMKQLHPKLAGLAIAAAALALAGPAAARTIGGWSVEPTDKTCMMSSAFADDVTLALVWDPAAGDLGFLAGGAWETLNGKRGERVALELKFDSNAEYTEWVDEGARVIAAPGGKHAVVGSWGSQYAEAFGSTVSSASRVTVRVGETELGAYDLTGTAAAYRELMRCGRELLPGS